MLLKNIIFNFIIVNLKILKLSIKIMQLEARACHCLSRLSDKFFNSQSKFTQNFQLLTIRCQFTNNKQFLIKMKDGVCQSVPLFLSDFFERSIYKIYIDYRTRTLRLQLCNNETLSMKVIRKKSTALVYIYNLNYYLEILFV